jgi:streptogramin lyase
MKEIPETHQKGLLTIEENNFESGICDLGIQIGQDGRIWICINGESFIRFNPLAAKYEKGWTDV